MRKDRQDYVPNTEHPDCLIEDIDEGPYWSKEAELLTRKTKQFHYIRVIPRKPETEE